MRLTPFLQLGDEIIGRINVAGISWAYTGTELTRGGRVYPTVDKGQHALSNSTPAALMGPSRSRSLPVKDGRSGMMSIPPMHNHDSHWVDNSQSFAWTEGSTGKPFAGLIFAGPAGNTFEVHLICHCEATGPAVQFFSTPGETADVDLINAIRTGAANTTYTAQAGTRSYAEMLHENIAAAASTPMVKQSIGWIVKQVYDYASFSYRNRGLQTLTEHGEL